MGNMRTLHSTTMCRLLGYATANENISLREVLGAQSTDAFRELSEIHNDGWGTAMVKEPDQTAHVTDGGAPSPSTGSAIYRNTIAARYDSIFGDLASVPVRGGIWHLRLASSNLPLVLENQQPFYASGLSFIHNGDISDAQGRNITTNRAYPVDHTLVQSTGGRSDSAIYFAIVLQYLGYGYELEEALAQAVRELRAAYPNSSYNCMIQSRDQLIVLEAHDNGPTSRTCSMCTRSMGVPPRQSIIARSDIAGLPVRMARARASSPRAVVSRSRQTKAGKTSATIA